MLSPSSAPATGRGHVAGINWQSSYALALVGGTMVVSSVAADVLKKLSAVHNDESTDDHYRFQYDPASVVLASEVLKFLASVGYCITAGYVPCNGRQTDPTSRYHNILGNSDRDNNSLAECNPHRIGATAGGVFRWDGIPTRCATSVRLACTRANLTYFSYYSIPALLYAGVNVIAFYAIASLGPAHFHLWYNLKIPLTALLLTIMGRKTLSRAQIIALTALTLACFVASTPSAIANTNSHVFSSRRSLMKAGRTPRHHASSLVHHSHPGSTRPKWGSPDDVQRTDIIDDEQSSSLNGGHYPSGLSLTLTMCFLSSLASVSNELLLKNIEQDIATQNAQLYLWGAIVTSARVYWTSSLEWGIEGLLVSFGRSISALGGVAWTIAILTTLDGLATSVMLKYGDANLKNGWASLGLLSVAIVSAMLGWEKFTWAVGVGIVISSWAIRVYSVNSLKAPSVRPLTSWLPVPPSLVDSRESTTSNLESAITSLKQQLTQVT
mmetsp:Transcript_12484/g.45517  ORF Transcript_12484/g.45517 Transcript_12484/m.45517 type:complete len:496 (-) Transcript_12484:1060-2547(-)